MTGDTIDDTAPRDLPAVPENPVVASLKADTETTARLHRTGRHVAVHAGGVSALGAVSVIAHIGGPVALGASVAASALIAVGGAAYRSRAKKPRGASRRRAAGDTARRRNAATRTVSRRSGTAAGATAGRRTSAHRRAHGGATGTLAKRTPRAAGVAQDRTRSRRATRPNSAPHRTASTGRRHGGLTGPGRTPSSRSERAATRRSTLRRPGPDAHKRPAGKRTHERAKTRRAQRTRFTDPAATPRKPKPQRPATVPKTKPATPPAPASRQTPIKPAPALTAPGQTPKDTPMPDMHTAGLAAVTEAVQQHIGNFQPQNATEILGFLIGLQETFSEFGSALIAVAERLSDEEPIDVSVTEHLRQIAGHTSTIGEWVSQTEGLFRMAHETELSRLDNPRANEEHWDITKNQ